MNIKKSLLLIVLFSIFVSSCTSHLVKSATARDTLFSVEESRSGTYGIFLTHDESVVYCTANQELGQKALALIEHHGEVIVQFKSPKILTDTEGELFGYSECQSYYNGESSFSQMILLDINPVPSR